MKKTKLLLFLITLSWTNAPSVSAQTSLARGSANEGSVFWEVSGNGLKEPSYLFGTFHLLTSAYIDSLPNVLSNFRKCKTFACELVIDSTVAPTMAAASLLNGTTLDKLLPAEDYQKTANWLKKLSGYELSMFNAVNPMTVSTIISVYLQQSLFPQDPANPKPGMDEYFQLLCKTNGKKVVGLETAEDQAYAIFTQFTNERQAELLSLVVNAPEKMASDMLLMNKYYREQNIDELVPLLNDSSFRKTELDIIFSKRNANWMKQIPIMMEQSSVFVAVGAGHIIGENGLVQLLRNAGYTVKITKL